MDTAAKTAQSLRLRHMGAGNWKERLEELNKKIYKKDPDKFWQIQEWIEKLKKGGL